MVDIHKVYLWIDRYPDFAFYMIAAVNIIIQLFLGVGLHFVVSVLALMFCNFLIVLATNLLMKNLLRASRPPAYYRVHGDGSRIFRGSFPSLHAQFAFAMATTFVVALYIYEGCRLLTPRMMVAIPIVYSMAFIVAMSRYLIVVHHLQDVLGGIIFGVVFSLPLTLYIYGAFDELPLVLQAFFGLFFLLLVFLLSHYERRHVSA